MAAKFSQLFSDFFNSEKVAGLLLVICAVISLSITNSPLGGEYLNFLHSTVDLSVGPVSLSYSVEHWVNDGLMTIFFLLVGLEIERELYVGELSTFKNAVLPVVGAVGGMVTPALIHFIFNAGTDTQAGFGIPMATDIAFALGILSLAGNRIPVSLKIFLTALAIIDDLGAITVIALFYTDQLSYVYLSIAIGIFLLLFIFGKAKIYSLPVYLLMGLVMWYCMLKSGIHASIAGVLLALAIPFHAHDERNPSYKLQHALHKPVGFLLLPIFALANTAIKLPADLLTGVTSNNGLGIFCGLLIGKLTGIFGFSWIAVKLRLASLPTEVTWRMLSGVAILAGIGFTMSMFIANLAFSNPATVTTSKISILLSSCVAAIVGLAVLRANHVSSRALTKSDAID